MNRKHLSPEEREEYDGLFEEAGFNEYGEILQSDQIKVNMRAKLEDAVQAGRPWAESVLSDALENGLLSAWKAWNNQQRRLKTIHNGAIVPARAVRGVRHRTPETGGLYHQQTLWREMTWDDVRQQLDKARKSIEAERVTESIANRLLVLLLECPDSLGPGDACERLELNFEAFLTGEEDVA